MAELAGRMAVLQLMKLYYQHTTIASY